MSEQVLDWNEYYYGNRNFSEIMKSNIIKGIINSDNSGDDSDQNNQEGNSFDENFSDHMPPQTISIENENKEEPDTKGSTSFNNNRRIILPVNSYNSENTQTLKTENLKSQNEYCMNMPTNEGDFLKPNSKADILKKTNADDYEEEIEQYLKEQYLEELKKVDVNLHISFAEETTFQNEIFQHENLNSNHLSISPISSGSINSGKINRKKQIFDIIKTCQVKDGKDYKKNFTTVMLLLKQWYQIRGIELKKSDEIPCKNLPNAVKSAQQMGISKKTLDYYQLTIRKSIALQKRIDIRTFFNQSFGIFSKKVYAIEDTLSSTEKYRVDLFNKSSQVKDRLKQFILEF